MVVNHALTSQMELNEVYVSKLQESKESPKHKGVLKTVEGIFAEADVKNRNGRKYSKRLWQKVLDSEYVKEMLSKKTLFGEASHPENRSDILLTEVSHVITDLWMTPEGKVYGRADILDTPSGRILATLIEYGSDIGISSRGNGTLYEDSNGDVWVNEDNYQFITFDFVPIPSVKIARPAVVESMNIKPLVESLKEQVMNASASEIPIIENVISCIEDENFSEVKYILENRKAQLSSDTSDSLQSEIQRLRSLNEELALALSKAEEDLKNSSSLQEEFNQFKSRIQKELETLAQENKSLKESLSRSRNSILNLTEENQKLSALYKSTKESFDKILSEMNDSDFDKYKSLTETVQKKDEYISDLIKKYNLLVEEYNELGEKTKKFRDRNLQLVDMISELASDMFKIPVEEIKKKLNPGFSLREIYSVCSEVKESVQPKKPTKRIKPPMAINESKIIENMPLSLNPEEDSSFRRIVRLLKNQ